jgi:hypothetical protein
MATPFEKLAVEGEHAGVVEYPRAPLLRTASMSWLFLIGCLPGFAALFLPFSRNSDALSYHTPLTYLAILAQDNALAWWTRSAVAQDYPVIVWSRAMLALSFFGLVPIIVWRRCARSASTSVLPLLNGQMASWLCLIVLCAWFGLNILGDCERLVQRARSAPVPMPAHVADVPMGMRIVWSVVTWILAGAFVCAGLWIAGRARRRGEMAAAIMARLMIVYLAPVGFALLWVGARERAVGWYLTVPTVSVLVGEMVLIALGQWPPRMQFMQRRTEDAAVASTQP